MTYTHVVLGARAYAYMSRLTRARAHTQRPAPDTIDQEDKHTVYWHVTLLNDTSTISTTETTCVQSVCETSV